MELSKDEFIFNVLENIKTYLSTDNNYISIKFINNGDFSETEFNNFIQTFRFNKNKENIKDEYLTVSFNDLTLTIEKIKNIILYCNSNSIKNTNAIWTKTDNIKSDKIYDLFDINLNFNVNINTPIESPPLNWEEEPKKFTFIKEFSYELEPFVYANAKIIKTSNKTFKELKKSQVLSSPIQKYEFELIIDAKNVKELNTNNLLDYIIMIIKSFFVSNIILTKKQQTLILKEYTELVKKDMTLPPYFNDIPLLTPKPFTLEQVNLVNPDDYGAVSILRHYTVTEKADGERILVFINSIGNVYLINSSFKVEDTGIKAKKEAFNSLLDGEYVMCNKRIDGIKKNIFAAFDIYYFNGTNLTSLPLIDEKEKSRYQELNTIIKFLDVKTSDFEVFAKTHRYSPDILNDCKEILGNYSNYPYEIDGLIFTPAKLSVYGAYPSIPVPITNNLGWDRVFKWKPPEQNSIDFLVRDMGEIKKEGVRYRKFALYVGTNPSINDSISIDEGLRLRYDREYSKKKYQECKQKGNFIPVLFKPIIYNKPNVEFAFIKVDINGEIRAENNDMIRDNIIVEFRYDINENLWIPIRTRIDKTCIYDKGCFNKTANALTTAMNVWHSIHNPVSKEMITGIAPLINKDIPEDIQSKNLEADEVYYSRSIPRRSLISYNMLTFHNIGINEMLYKKPLKKYSLLDLACGQSGDMSRWISAGYKFVLGIDLVKENIYKGNEGAYARLLKEYGKFNKSRGKETSMFLNAVFAAGDCALDIKSGTAGVDEESKEILKIVMSSNPRITKPYYKYIAGKGANKFDVITCMFAIHYFFENQKKLEGFLNNVSSNLKKDGVFICTFMDGESVERELEASKDKKMVEGRKTLNGVNILVWAIIKRFTDEINYNKKVDIFIENTQRIIPEYLVNFNFLIEKTKEFDLEVEETELYSETFNKIKSTIPENEELQTSLHKNILELDKDPVQKQLSFINRWVVFKKKS